jgi:tight adherence protein B
LRALAVVLAGLAAALGAGGRQNVLLARLTSSTASGGRTSASARIRADGRVRPWSHGLTPRRRAAAALAVGAMTGVATGHPGLTVVACAAIGLFGATRRRSTAARRLQHAETAVSEACLLLAAELRSGAHPREAVAVAAAEWPDLFGPAARRAAAGGEFSSALREAAGPGRSALSAVAAGWEVSERTGAALSDVLTAVGDSLRADAAVRREAEAQLSPVRVTGRLLALLPVGTLLLLSGGDAAPMRFLVDSPYGLACLTCATVLVASGLWWIERLVRSATTSSWS